MADIFQHCGDDDAEQRWEDLLEAYDEETMSIALAGKGVLLPPTDRQRYAMRVSWLETERHRKLRKSVKQQWDAQNPPQEEDEIMDAAKKAENPAIKEAGLPAGVAEAVVDPRLMPPPEMIQQWAEQTTPLQEGASIYDMDPAQREYEEEHGLGRFRQGMRTPDAVRSRLVHPEREVEIVRREETVCEHLQRIGVTYKHRTSTRTGRVWLNIPADKLAAAEGRPYTKDKK